MRPGDVTILGGGWSVSAVDLGALCGFVIGVNDAAVYYGHPDAVVSMDRLWTEHRWEWLRARQGATWLRRSAVQNCPHRWTELQVFECDNESTEFSDDHGTLNGTNSGMCALNLAWLIQPRRVFLLGFDMNRSPAGRAYWHPPYPWTRPEGATTEGKYKAWAKQYDRAAQRFAAAGIKVFNVSPKSALQSFKKIQPSDYAREARR